MVMDDPNDQSGGQPDLAVLAGLGLGSVGRLSLNFHFDLHHEIAIIFIYNHLGP